MFAAVVQILSLAAVVAALYFAADELTKFGKSSPAKRGSLLRLRRVITGYGKGIRPKVRALDRMHGRLRAPTYSHRGPLATGN